MATHEVVPQQPQKGPALVELIPLSSFVASKTNPTERTNEDSLRELADDILQRGVLEPIKARPWA